MAANEQSTASKSDEEPGEKSQDQVFDEFYSEVKAIEKHDSSMTSKQQIDRLTRPGATYFNLNPFDVLQIDPDTPMAAIKKKYRMMSILVHPDKNQEDQERAQSSFEAVNKAYKTLENDEGMRRCIEIVDEAKERVEELIKNQRKKLKKEGKPLDVPEDDHDKAGQFTVQIDQVAGDLQSWKKEMSDVLYNSLKQYKHAVYVQTCKLFADLERLRVEKEAKDMHERKRKAEEDALEKEKEEMEKEWNKNFEASRAGRVDSWRQFTTGKKSSKKMKGAFRPPKPKLEKR